MSINKIDRLIEVSREYQHCITSLAYLKGEGDILTSGLKWKRDFMKDLINKYSQELKEELYDINIR